MSKIDEVLRESYMEKVMNEYKQEALRKLSAVLAHQVLEDVALILANGWFESLPSAERLADQLDLGKIDFLALLEDSLGFEECLMMERKLLYG